MAAADRKSTYTAAEVAVLKDRIAKQQEEIDQLKRKLEHMNEVFANAQRARFGQSSEKNTYVSGIIRSACSMKWKRNSCPRRRNPPRKPSS